VNRRGNWKIAVEQAENVAKPAGKLPAGVTRSLEQAEAAGVDWREWLRRAWSSSLIARKRFTSQGFFCTATDLMEEESRLRVLVPRKHGARDVFGLVDLRPVTRGEKNDC
jgi:hypothetical protein